MAFSVFSSFIISYRHYFSTITLFFVLIYIFSVLRQRAACCVFCPAGGRGSHLASWFVNLLSKCGGGQVPPNFFLFLRGAAS